MLTDKDKEAIAHIASASKHPHAAMIAEWLITDCDVEISNNKGWDLIEQPTQPAWSRNFIYRLVYPKIKPAYRVYRLPDGLTSTVDRMKDGTLTNTNHDLPWVSDWIEYDDQTQDNKLNTTNFIKHRSLNLERKWPTPLVERIAAIDIKAAEWIVDNWDDLVARKYNGDPESRTLHCMFTWCKTPQGTDYWLEISKQLGEK